MGSLAIWERKNVKLLFTVDGKYRFSVKCSAIINISSDDAF